MKWVKCLAVGYHICKNKTLPAKARRETRRLATNEHEAIVSIPEVIRIAVVRVKPTIIVIVLDVEQVQITIGVVMYKVPSISPLFDYS